MNRPLLIAGGVAFAVLAGLSGEQPTAQTEGESSVTVGAQAPAADNLVWAMAAFEGDADSGATIAEAGTEAGAAPCSGCHGERGEGNLDIGSPQIAGQPAFYLAKQLSDYAAGTRQSEIMQPIAQALTEEERNNVAAYYALLTPQQPPPVEGAPDSDLMAWGKTLTLVGSNEDGVQACVNCHGPSARGLPPVAPYLAGLDPTYMQQQIQRWKSGERRNDIAGIMRGVAERLDERDITAVTAYLGTLRSEAPQ